MKKTLFSAVLAATFGFVALSAHAASGTITFTGTVTDVSCTVSPGTGTTGNNGNFTVALDPTPASNLKAVGDRAMDKQFTLIVGGSGQGGCTDGKIASLKFEQAQSTQINTATGRLKNTGTATNVEIGLLNDAKADINLGLDPVSANTTAMIANNTATLVYYAQYVATGAATAGSVNTNVVYSMQYN